MAMSCGHIFNIGLSRENILKKILFVWNHKVRALIFGM